MEYIGALKDLAGLSPGDITLFGALIVLAVLYLFGLHKEFHVLGSTHKLLKQQLETANATIAERTKERDDEREARLTLQTAYDRKTEDEINGRLELVALRKERELSVWSRPFTNPEAPR